jgi:hypothetical protein
MSFAHLSRTVRFGRMLFISDSTLTKIIGDQTASALFGFGCAANPSLEVIRLECSTLTAGSGVCFALERSFLTGVAESQHIVEIWWESY